MNLYLIAQSVNTDYDTYDSAVVAAKTASEAKKTLPNNMYSIFDVLEVWSNSKDVKVKYIGRAKSGTKQGVILASFNAG
jgi:hypothetical protein